GGRTSSDVGIFYILSGIALGNFYIWLTKRTFVIGINVLSMEEAKVIIDRLRARVAAILGAMERVKGDLAKRTAERDKALKQKEDLERKVAELEDRVRVLELTAGMKGVSGGSKAAKERVNRLLREVDKCIALMNR
ncbi:hypothetical protein LJB87_02845, partial [Alistipes sp. OttesenSCG-928-L06]|nr:hypothetical protein [Alistipes sp. OttesenSCG-928-L06]